MAELNLRNRSGFWIEGSIEYTTTNEKGLQKTMTEKYCVEAVDFTQAEARLRAEMNCANRAIKIKAVVRPKYGEICFNDQGSIEDFWLVKVAVTEEVEVKTRKGGVKTKTKVRTRAHLVQATSDVSARTAIKEVVYKDSTEDWEIVNITKTKLLGVLERDKHLDNLAEERAKKEAADAELNK